MGARLQQSIACHLVGLPFRNESCKAVEFLLQRIDAILNCVHFHPASGEFLPRTRDGVMGRDADKVRDAMRTMRSANLLEPIVFLVRQTEADDTISFDERRQGGLLPRRGEFSRRW